MRIVLCRNCASELAADARFCVKCGTSVDPSETSPAPLPNLGESAQPANPIEPPAAALPDPPYAVFVAHVLGLALSLSVLALSATDNLAHGYWHVSVPFGIAFVAALAFMFRLPGIWRAIESGKLDDPGHPGKLLSRGIVFVLLFVASAALVGHWIGKSGKETAQLIADFHEMSRVGTRISEARNSAAPNVPAHIAMYKAIEDDVLDFETVLRRLQAELPAYDERFPNQHEVTAKSMQTVETSLKRATLLRQQITVARDIELMDSHSRWQAWQQRMQPLLDAELALDKN